MARFYIIASPSFMWNNWSWIITNTKLSSWVVFLIKIIHNHNGCEVSRPVSVSRMLSDHQYFIKLCEIQCFSITFLFSPSLDKTNIFNIKVSFFCNSEIYETTCKISISARKCQLLKFFFSLISADFHFPQSRPSTSATRFFQASSVVSQPGAL